MTSEVADRDYHRTDAGRANSGAFIVEAADADSAVALGTAWSDMVRQHEDADDAADAPPDFGDMKLHYREYGPGRTYAMLVRRNVASQ